MREVEQALASLAAARLSLLRLYATAPPGTDLSAEARAQWMALEEMGKRLIEDVEAEAGCLPDKREQARAEEALWDAHRGRQKGMTDDDA